MAVKHLDHINFLSSNPEADGDFAETVLGMRLTEQILLNNGRRPGVWYSPNTKSYEMVYTLDATGSRGRFHHMAFSVDTNEGIWSLMRIVQVPLNLVFSAIIRNKMTL